MFIPILISGLILFLLIMFSLIRVSTPAEKRQDDEDQLNYLKDYMKKHSKK